MGLIKNTSDIVYNLTKAQELRQKRENEKRLEQDLKNDVKFIKGVGPERVKSLNKLGIYTLEDLRKYLKKNILKY